MLASMTTMSSVSYTSVMSGTQQKVEALLEKVRPYIQMHGGDVILLRIEDSTAVLKVHGACVDCTLASVTYNDTIKPLMIKEVEEIEDVVFE